MSCAILIPQPGTEPRPLAVKAQSPNLRTTRGFPRISLTSLHYHSHSCGSLCWLLGQLWGSGGVAVGKGQEDSQARTDRMPLGQRLVKYAAVCRSFAGFPPVAKSAGFVYWVGHCQPWWSHNMAAIGNLAFLIFFSCQPTFDLCHQFIKNILAEFFLPAWMASRGTEPKQALPCAPFLLAVALSLEFWLAGCPAVPALW